MEETDSLCSNCGAVMEPSARVCPRCGFVVRTLPGAAPRGSLRTSPGPLLTGRAWTDFGLGAAVQYLVHLAATRLLVRMIPPVNPAGFYDFIGISRDWSRDSVVSNVTLLQILELLVLGALGYFLGRRFYPTAARGFGYATLALFMVLLGAFFTCRTLRY